jgi:DNA-binding LacI/PurR family transcriptional regulator
MNRQVRQPFTIKEVANRAGVSPATVSRVLNDSVSVREAKRAEVLAVINELGYRPSRVASNLRRQQVQMIGVVVSDIENPHFSQMVRAIEDSAYLKGYRVLLCNTDEDPVKQREYLGVLIAERVAGAIISPTEAGAPEISELIDSGASVVAFDRAVDDKGADSVLAANAAGGRLGTEHLLAVGHKSVGFLGGPTGVQTAAERLLGYERAMSAAGLQTRTSNGNFRVEGGRRGAQDLIDDGATALLVANNLMAVGALQAIRKANLRVPADVAIVSFDDPPWAELTDPPLTTLAQPVRAMAAASVELLMHRLGQGRERPKCRVFELELRHRGSCCPKEV